MRGHGVDRVLLSMDLALMRRTHLNAFRVNSWPVPEVALGAFATLCACCMLSASGFFLKDVCLYVYCTEVRRMHTLPSADLCDEMGFLVQGEVPAIALRKGWDPACTQDIFAAHGSCANASTLEAHKEAFAALWSRDRHHASVISVSLANEPEARGDDPAAVTYFSSVMEFSRSTIVHGSDVLLTIEGPHVVLCRYYFSL
jgi:hypothetical protein